MVISNEPPFQLTSKQVEQGAKWLRDPETRDHVLCPECGQRLVSAPRFGKTYHICERLLQSDEPLCDYYVEAPVVKVEKSAKAPLPGWTASAKGSSGGGKRSA